eukprot:10875785-Prorocentrum_lima.AAC.1
MGKESMCTSLIIWFTTVSCSASVNSVVILFCHQSLRGVQAHSFLVTSSMVQEIIPGIRGTFSLY